MLVANRILIPVNLNLVHLKLDYIQIVGIGVALS